ncbi:MAG: hypothetical protein J5598_00050, partial [Clostridia bacterium]|nr:hypothetical protein [Clostridia bacterium]
VKMTTQSGSLHASVIKGGLHFIAGSASLPLAVATLNVEKVTGETKVENYGFGGVTVHNADGDVTIKSSEIGGGIIDVSFANGANESNKLTIVGYDGNISASNINGGIVDISVAGGLLRAGYANVNVQFNQVGTATIRTGSYPDAGSNWGNVDVRLGDHCNDLNLFVYHARSVDVSERCNSGNQSILVNQNESGTLSNYITVSDNSGTVGTIKIYSQTNVYLS